MARATLKQVADTVGVNISTVSRVLNRPERAKVSEVTRQRILAAAASVGYRVHATAQALARGRVGTVGMLVPDYLDVVYMRYVEELSRLFDEAGSLLLPMVTQFRPDLERRALRALGSGRADLVLALRYEPANAEFYQEFAAGELPLVFRVPDPRSIPFDAVEVDVTAGFGALAAEFAARGRRRIGLLGGCAARELAVGNRETTSVRGFVERCREAGVVCGPEMAVPCNEDAESAREALLEACREAPGRFDALVVQANRLLPGVVAALRQLGLSVPGAVSLGVISDSEFCRVAGVPVTVWAQPVEEICKVLFQLTQRRLDNPEAEIRQVAVESHLIERGEG